MKKQILEKKKVDEVVQRLKELDNSSVKFYHAKLKLSEEGFTNSEIVAGVYEFPYDGIPNEKRKPNRKMELYFEKNPDKADKFCKAVMNLHEAQMTQELKISDYAHMASSGFFSLSFIPSSLNWLVFSRGVKRRTKKRKNSFFIR